MATYGNKPYAEPFFTLGLVPQDITSSLQDESNFYKRKDGTIFPYLKEDIKKQIDVFKPCTFLPIFKELDIPFYEEDWLRQIQRNMEKGHDLSLTFGQYYAKMKLHDFKIRGFQDSDKFFSNINAYENFRYVPEIRFRLSYNGETFR